MAAESKLLSCGLAERGLQAGGVGEGEELNDLGQEMIF